jgi:uncharacterized protein
LVPIQLPKAVRRLILSPVWILLALPGYVGWRLLSAASPGSSATIAGTALWIACCLLIPLSLRARGTRNQKMADGLSWVGMTALGFFFSLLILTVLRDFVLLGVNIFGSAQQATNWILPSAQCTLLLAALITLAGLAIARRTPAVVNDLHADLIAVTGDLVDGSVQQLSTHTAPLARLTARHGAYFVTGNHEYYSGERAWSEEIRRLGLRVLKNEHVVLQHDGASLVLAGGLRRTPLRSRPTQRPRGVAAWSALECGCEDFTGTSAE